MGRSRKLLDQLDAFETEYRDLVVAELEQSLRRHFAPYLLRKMDPALGEGIYSRLWTAEAETLVQLERKILALRKKLAGTIAGSPLEVVEQHVRARRVTHADDERLLNELRRWTSTAR
ncbi:MAG TPA: hypothetical protein VFF06_02270 [Polyangia bacterium]|nr:hypothetical protein [Polyangia bacterium]